MYTVHVRVNKLLTAVQRAIHGKIDNFHIFLEVLDAIPKYKNLVERMKASMAGVKAQDYHIIWWTETFSQLQTFKKVLLFCVLICILYYYYF